jgi:hypothetical protein
MNTGSAPEALKAEAERFARAVGRDAVEAMSKHDDEFRAKPRKKTKKQTTIETVRDYIDFAPYDMPVAERRKLDVGDIFINQVRCTNCGWYIRSRNRHDFVTCKCGKVSIDGGSWYTKLSGSLEFAELHTLPYKEQPG